MEQKDEESRSIELKREALRAYFELPKLSLIHTTIFSLTYQYTYIKNEPPSTNLISGDDEFCIMRGSEQRNQKPESVYWHRISKGLYIGKMPEKNSFFGQDEAKAIIDLVENDGGQLKMVVSVVDYFELGGVGLLTGQAISPKDWDSLGIAHEHLIMSDFKGNAPPELVIATLYRTKAVIDHGGSVVVHCKAGVGRSASLGLAYLTLFGDGIELLPNNKLSPALAYLKEKRRISINPKQLSKTTEYVNFYHSCDSKEISNLTIKPFVGSTIEDIDIFLTSTPCLNAIRQLVSFKELAIYATKHLSMFFGTCARSQLISQLFVSIYQAQNSFWYADMINNRGPLRDFIVARSFPPSKSDSDYRLSLANHFKQEVTELIAYGLKLYSEKVIEVVNDHAEEDIIQTHIYSP